MKAVIAKSTLTLTKKEFKFLQDFENFLRDYAFATDGDDADIDEVYINALEGFYCAINAEEVNTRYKNNDLQIEIVIED